MDALSCIDQCFIADEALNQLPEPSQGQGESRRCRLQQAADAPVSEAVLALSVSPTGFTSSELADKVRVLNRPTTAAYSPRQAAYDLKKLGGKQIARRIDQTRKYETIPAGLKALTAIVVPRNKAFKPLLAAAQLQPTRGGQNPAPLDNHYEILRLSMQGIFRELGVAA